VLKAFRKFLTKHEIKLVREADAAPGLAFVQRDRARPIENYYLSAARSGRGAQLAPPDAVVQRPKGFRIHHA
jgi:hypothetical protein